MAARFAFVTVLEGDRVVLRPIREEEFDVVWHGHLAASEAEAIRFDREEVRRRVQSSGEMTDWGLLLGIESAGRLVGEVQGYRSAMPGVFGIGIVVYEPADRGKGSGGDAVRALTRHLFDEEGARRVEGGTMPDNTPMRRVFAGLGFVEEGTLRRFLPGNDGEGADCVVYGMTKQDYREASTEWI
ncbi:MAG: GNAT family N-acetyltransferase [Actinomycetota bacterium]